MNNGREGSNPSFSAKIFWAYDAPIAQLDRVSDYESEGREFKSLWARQ